MASFYRVNIHTANNEDLHHAFALTDSAGIPVDLTGASIAMDIETPAGSDAIEVSTGNGHIVIVEPSQGQFEIQVPVGLMRLLSAGVYRHDLVLAQSGRTRRIWEGVLTVSRGVTE